MTQRHFSKIMTVCGQIPPARLGYTLSHEHLLCYLWPFLRRYDAILDDEKLAAKELSEFRKSGGRTIIDCTSGGLGRKPEALRRISKATGIHVIMGAAWYREEVYPSLVKELNTNSL